jgi:hypothetical protein
MFILKRLVIISLMAMVLAGCSDSSNEEEIIEIEVTLKNGGSATLACSNLEIEETKDKGKVCFLKGASETSVMSLKTKNNGESELNASERRKKYIKSCEESGFENCIDRLLLLESHKLKNINMDIE